MRAGSGRPPAPRPKGNRSKEFTIGGRSDDDDYADTACAGNAEYDDDGEDRDRDDIDDDGRDEDNHDEAESRDDSRSRHRRHQKTKPRISNSITAWRFGTDRLGWRSRTSSSSYTSTSRSRRPTRAGEEDTTCSRRGKAAAAGALLGRDLAAMVGYNLSCARNNIFISDERSSEDSDEREQQDRYAAKRYAAGHSLMDDERPESPVVHEGSRADSGASTAWSSSNNSSIRLNSFSKGTRSGTTTGGTSCASQSGYSTTGSIASSKSRTVAMISSMAIVVHQGGVLSCDCDTVEPEPKTLEQTPCSVNKSSVNKARSSSWSVPGKQLGTILLLGDRSELGEQSHSNRTPDLVCTASEFPPPTNTSALASRSDVSANATTTDSASPRARETPPPHSNNESALFAVLIADTVERNTEQVVANTARAITSVPGGYAEEYLNLEGTMRGEKILHPPFSPMKDALSSGSRKWGSPFILCFAPLLKLCFGFTRPSPNKRNINRRGFKRKGESNAPAKENERAIFELSGGTRSTTSYISKDRSNNDSDERELDRYAAKRYAAGLMERPKSPAVHEGSRADSGASTVGSSSNNSIRLNSFSKGTRSGATGSCASQSGTTISSRNRTVASSSMAIVVHQGGVLSCDCDTLEPEPKTLEQTPGSVKSSLKARSSWSVAGKQSGTVVGDRSALGEESHSNRTADLVCTAPESPPTNTTALASRMDVSANAKDSASPRARETPPLHSDDESALFTVLSADTVERNTEQVVAKTARAISVPGGHAEKQLNSEGTIRGEKTLYPPFSLRRDASSAGSRKWGSPFILCFAPILKLCFGFTRPSPNKRNINRRGFRKKGESHPPAKENERIIFGLNGGTRSTTSYISEDHRSHKEDSEEREDRYAAKRYAAGLMDDERPESPVVHEGSRGDSGASTVGSSSNNSSIRLNSFSKGTKSATCASHSGTTISSKSRSVAPSMVSILVPICAISSDFDTLEREPNKTLERKPSSVKSSLKAKSSWSVAGKQSGTTVGDRSALDEQSHAKRSPELVCSAHTESLSKNTTALAPRMDLSKNDTDSAASRAARKILYSASEQAFTVLNADIVERMREQEVVAGTAKANSFPGGQPTRSQSTQRQWREKTFHPPFTVKAISKDESSPLKTRHLLDSVNRPE